MKWVEPRRSKGPNVTVFMTDLYGPWRSISFKVYKKPVLGAIILNTGTEASELLAHNLYCINPCTYKGRTLTLYVFCPYFKRQNLLCCLDENFLVRYQNPCPSCLLSLLICCVGLHGIESYNKWCKENDFMGSVMG